MSTFTYTNAVPQCKSFNGGWWKRAENRIRRYAQHYCTQGQQPGTLYLITGTSLSRFDPQNFPHANYPMPDHQYYLNQQIWIPVSMWTAGCCVRPDNDHTESFAVIGNNRQNQAPGPDGSLTRQVTVVNLQVFLRNDAIRNHFTNGGPNHAPNVRLFPGNQNCLTNTQLDILHLPLPG